MDYGNDWLTVLLTERRLATTSLSLLQSRNDFLRSCNFLRLIASKDRNSNSCFVRTEET